MGGSEAGVGGVAESCLSFPFHTVAEGLSISSGWEYIEFQGFFPAGEAFLQHGGVIIQSHVRDAGGKGEDVGGVTVAIGAMKGIRAQPGCKTKHRVLLQMRRKRRWKRKR